MEREHEREGSRESVRKTEALRTQPDTNTDGADVRAHPPRERPLLCAHVTLQKGSSQVHILNFYNGNELESEHQQTFSEFASYWLQARGRCTLRLCSIVSA